MPRRGRAPDFQELSPNRTASELFSHLQAGDKVAITSRFPNSVGDYVTALKARGLVVRVIKEQPPLADFCFLLKAQKEIVGPAHSTFSTWAGMLGEAKKVRLYSVDPSFISYNYTNKKLLSIVSHELFL